MIRDDIVKWAQEAAIMPPDWGATENQWRSLEAFANLVAAAERERIKWDTIHSCHPKCDKPVCVAIRKAVAEEREACAKVCDEMAGKDRLSNYFQVAALAIRERGAP
jgi:hypothetical protein